MFGVSFVFILFFLKLVALILEFFKVNRQM